MIIKKHFDLYALHVVDSVTGFKGVVTSIAFDLEGCVQAAVSPSHVKNKEFKHGQWFDVSRLKVKSRKTVMAVPIFTPEIIREAFKFFALKVKDKVTNLEGVVDSISFDLYGCIQASIRPPVNDKSEIPNGRWFDLKRILILSEDPVMDVPNFEYGKQAQGQQGASENPYRFEYIS